MNKNFKSIFSVVLCAVITLSALTAVSAQQYSLFTEGLSAKVLQVIDGDSIIAKSLDTGEVGLVRFAGINAKGFDDTFEYLNNILPGKTVELYFDYYSPNYINGRWNNMRVVLNGESLNLKLVSLGYAAFDENYAGESAEILAQEETSAQGGGLGLWDTSVAYNNHYTEGTVGAGAYIYEGDGVNINTANAASLAEHMPEVPQSVIYNIVYLRDVNPFSVISDIKFIPGFTKDLFDLYRSRMTVSTNIATATQKELMTLGYIRESEASGIIAHREKGAFTSAADLLSFNLISANLYEIIKPYVSITNDTDLKLAVPNIRVNIDEASYDVLVELGMPQTQAQAIVDARQKYSAKTLGELRRMPGVYLTDYEIHKYADNIFTTGGDYININFAGTEDLRALGLTDDEVSKIYAKRALMFSPNDLPVDILRVNSRISLYTNVNKATAREFESLGVNPETIDAIMDFRKSQPFGSLDEFRALFEETAPAQGYSTYASISAFLTVR
ncbi:MAG: helix-hairpin-helix domain-containing protein [Clostridiales bacterium]|jgi:DNA uptake protein ComE-like DNA-binding protein/endonuclease YncB( thermonuclease family)|nr:helix-hairpin-helix domain-containing protein [Clostridiales bacterium]